MPAILATVRQHRRWLIGTVLVVLAATALAYLLLPRQFNAHADIWLDHGFDELGAATAPVAGSSASPLARNTELRILTSSDLAGEVVDRLGLANVRGVGQPAAGALVPRDAARRRAIQAVRDNLRVEATGASYAVAVRYTAADPVLATGILNQLVDSYVDDRRSGGARGRERALIRRQVAAARDAMIRNEAAVNGYSAATDLIRKQDDSTLIKAELAALDDEVASANAARAKAEARLGPIGASGDAGATSPRIRQLRAQQAQLAAQRGTATGVRDPGELAVNQALQAEVLRATTLLARAREARERVELLTAARARANNELRASMQAAARLRQFRADADAARARYADVARRYAQLLAAQRQQRGTAYVIAHARVPALPSFPNPLLFALLALIGAPLAAALVLFAREAFVKGFRTRQHLERALRLPVIGMVPDLGKVRGADVPVDDPMGPADYLYINPRSTFAQAFRSIHTGLRLGGDTHSPRTIAVCSAVQGEGKTTVAICLARSAAMAGLRVVLIDCDARRPAASRALSAYTEVGLAEVLGDGVPVRDALQRDTPSGAWFLAQGTNRTAPVGAISSPAMTALIAKLGGEFDLVILDTPPALALVEARQVAALADAVLLVARARRTPVEATRIANDQLAQAGATVVAAALTLVDP